VTDGQTARRTDGQTDKAEGGDITKFVNNSEQWISSRCQYKFHTFIGVAFQTFYTTIIVVRKYFELLTVLSGNKCTHGSITTKYLYIKF